MNTSFTYHQLGRIEKVVIEALARGLVVKEIAAERNRSVRTAENQLRTIREKSQTRNIAELISWYYITRYRILVSILFLSITFSNLVFDNPTLRCRSVRQSKCRTSRTRRNDEEPIFLNGFDIE